MACLDFSCVYVCMCEFADYFSVFFLRECFAFCEKSKQNMLEIQCVGDCQKKRKYCALFLCIFACVCVYEGVWKSSNENNYDSEDLLLK